jgi:hypothetical protein
LDQRDVAAYIASLPKVSRTCVFCGQPPQDKNNEHVIPQWLLKLTGDENRVAWFGFDHAKGKPRKFAFDQFQFPACSECNERFGREVETPAREALVRLLEEGRIESRGAESLLDWLDKVRVGLWLGQRYLERDLLGISPHFHVKTRIRQKDRLVAIYRTKETRQSLTFAGWGTPAFQFTPGCLALRVNSYFLVNISGDFLFSKRAGTGYAEDLRFLMVDGEARLTCDLRPGTGQIRVPLLPLRELPGRSISFFQPIVPESRAKDGADRRAADVGPLFAETRFGTWATKRGFRGRREGSAGHAA